MIPVISSENDRMTSEIFGQAAPTAPQYYAGQAAGSSFIDKFPWENQMGENSCVAHATALNWAIYRNIIKGQPYVQPSPAFIYYFRSNSPTPGMIPGNANEITEIQGDCDYADYPSPENDADIDSNPPSKAVQAEAAKNTIGSWLTSSTPGNIDSIAYIVNTLGIAAKILIFATDNEWSMVSPVILDPNLTIQTATVRHCVSVLPHSAYKDENGKRWVIIQDSAFFGGHQYRYISEDWIAARCVRIDYIAELASTPAASLTPYTFSTDLKVGSSGPSVLALQIALTQLGFFPALLNGSAFSPTGQYFGITKGAVMAFQNAYAAEILIPQGLSEATGYFGPSTRAQLNKLLNS